MRNLEVIPATLSFLMQVRGMDQAELGRRTGMHKSQLSGYLTGRKTPQLPQILRLAEGLSVTPSQFFMVTERMKDLKKRLGKRPEDEKLRAADPVLAAVLKAADEARREALEAEAESRGGAAGGGDWPRKFLLAQKLAQRSNLLYLEALEECFGRLGLPPAAESGEDAEEVGEPEEGDEDEGGGLH